MLIRTMKNIIVLKNKKDLFLESFYKKGVVFPKITDIKVDELISTIKSETYILINKSFMMLVNYIFNNSF